MQHYNSQTLNIINALFVEVFNDILRIEEKSLRQGEFKDVSIREIHILEGINLTVKKTMTEVAKKLHITTGTLTTAIDTLVKKGYVKRNRSLKDRRIVNLKLTEKGVKMNQEHSKFHQEFVVESIKTLEPVEVEVLTKTLVKLHKLFEVKGQEII